MKDEKLINVLRRGIAGFANNTEDASEALLGRIMHEVDFPKELDDDMLDMLAAAGNAEQDWTKPRL